MKTVKIVTFHSAINFGAFMQAYALCRTIENMGFKVELIDFQPYLKTKKGKQIESDINREIIFREFQKHYLPLSSETYTCLDQIKNLIADVLVCGSDQIWNLGIGNVRKNRDVYFLNFGTDSIKRVSYAASTGGTPIPSEHFDFVRKALSAFSYISLREPESLNNIKDATHIPLKVMLDPTLLWDQYPETDIFSKYRLPDKYVAVYGLQKSPIIFDAIKKIKGIYNLPVINIGFIDMPLVEYNFNLLNPAGWSSFIKHADLVITNSFHGTIFSIKHRRQFLSVPLIKKNPKRKLYIEELIYKVKLQNIFTCFTKETKRPWLEQNYSPKNSRIENILNIVGLPDRLYKYHNDVSFVRVPIDYGKVKKRLDQPIENSVSFLKTALNS